MDPTTLLIDQLIAAFRSLVATVGPPMFQLAEALLFETPKFGELAPVAQVWTTLLGIADTVFVVGLVVMGVLAMSAGTFQTAYTVKRLLPRVVLAAVMSNTSLALIGTLTDLNNGLVSALVGPDPTNGIWGQLAQGLASADPGIEALTATVSLVAVILALLLVASCVLRAVVLLVLTVVAPLAVATYGLPVVEDIAHLWWRVLGAALFVQVAQAVVVDAGEQLAAHVGWLGAPVSPLLDAVVVLVVVDVVLLLPLWAFRWAVPPAAHSRLAQTIVAVMASGAGG